jgi:hypothetical protein
MGRKIIFHRLCSGIWLTGMWIAPLVFAQTYRLLSPEVIDLGRVLEGQTVDGDVRFINSGTEPLHVLGVQTSCGCTAARLQKTDFSTGDTAIVHFTLRTGGFHGLIRKMLTVDFENQLVNDLAVYIQATVFSELEVKPSFLNFQSVPQSKDIAVADTISVFNTSNRTVKVLNVSCDSQQIQIDVHRFSIPSNQNILIPVVLRPQKSEYQHATVTIETDSPNKPVIRIPVLFDIVE